MHRYLLRFLVAGLTAVGVVVGGAAPALAHATLLSTEPGYGAILGASPGEVILHYDLPVETDGAQVTFERAGQKVRPGRPEQASDDGRDISLPVPEELGAGDYLLTWYLFGTDGDVMGGEVAFKVSASAAPTAGSAAPPPDTSPRAFAPLSEGQDAARLLGLVSVVVAVGGTAFVAGLWRAGAGLARTRLLLGAALALSLVSTATNFGLKGAAVSGQSALGAFSPAAFTALDGTRVGEVLTARLGFLALAALVVAYLIKAPERAFASHRWWITAIVAAGGTLATHGMLSHAAASQTNGTLAAVVDVVHFGAICAWLGGLTMLVVVALPRRRRAELARLVPRFSRLAFVCVSTAAVTGGALLVLISPRWAALPSSAYGRFLFIKLFLVVALLVTASRSRNFVRRHLPALAADAGTTDLVGASEERVSVAVGSTAAPVAGERPPNAMNPGSAKARDADEALNPEGLRPFVSSVLAELCVAASILAVTAALAGRAVPV